MQLCYCLQKLKIDNVQALILLSNFLQGRFEEESRAKSAAHDALIAADRRAHASQNALEEARTLLDQADRSRRQLEQELADTNETLSDQTCQNQALTAAKRKCEQELEILGVGRHHFLLG